MGASSIEKSGNRPRGVKFLKVVRTGFRIRSEGAIDCLAEGAETRGT